MVKVEVTERENVYDGRFKLERAVLRYEQYDGRMSKPVERLLFERGDSVAVLLYNRQRGTVVLVEQFRYPAYVREGENDGRLLEVVAGTIDARSSPDEVARAELVEEAGYALHELEHVCTFYPSPGACSERIYLYLGYLSDSAWVGAGGGLTEHGEDIRVVELPLAEAWRMVQEGMIRDAKTIIALQYVMLHS